MSANKCCYVLDISKPGPAGQCKKPTRFKIVKDDDQNRVRKYDPFCPDHRLVVDKEEQEIKAGLRCEECGLVGLIPLQGKCPEHKA